MAKHTYQRINGEELGEALSDIGLTVGQFARLTGADRRRVTRWLADEYDIPHHILLICELLKDPGNMQTAKELADEQITGEAA